MTELDFDELDKAVNNLMSNVDTSKRSIVADDPEDTVVSIESPVLASTTPATTSPVADPVTTDPAAQTVATTAPPLAVKRRGQFMDVMHRSSDMKSSPLVSPSRQGVAVQPSNPTLVVEVPAAPPQAPADDVLVLPQEMESTSTTVVPVASEQNELPAQDLVSEQVDTKSEWPDPIDVATQTATAESSNDPEVIVSSDMPSDNTPAPNTSDTDVDTELTALTSPFLQDAKVEKRPLGALSDVSEPQTPDVAAATPIDVATTELVDKKPDDSPQTPPAIQLPEELNSDVIALESSSTGAQVATEPSSGGSGQIAQQYEEQSSSGDQHSTAIYDTSTHAQPLAATAKKPSVWKWVIWFFVLAIVSVLGGAAYFYFTT